MSANSAAVLVQRVRNPFLGKLERRGSERHEVALPATTVAMEPGEALSWGATVVDISTGGIGMTLCYPFRPGSYLAVALQTGADSSRTLMVRVVHIHEETDGRWRLGCEFLEPLDSDVLDQIKLAKKSR
jgi:hypothetical protein